MWWTFAFLVLLIRDNCVSIKQIIFLSKIYKTFFRQCLQLHTQIFSHCHLRSWQAWLCHHSVHIHQNKYLGPPVKQKWYHKLFNLYQSYFKQQKSHTHQNYSLKKTAFYSQSCYIWRLFKFPYCFCSDLSLNSDNIFPQLYYTNTHLNTCSFCVCVCACMRYLNITGDECFLKQYWNSNENRYVQAYLKSKHQKFNYLLFSKHCPSKTAFFGQGAHHFPSLIKSLSVCPGKKSEANQNYLNADTLSIISGEWFFNSLFSIP